MPAERGAASRLVIVGASGLIGGALTRAAHAAGRTVLGTALNHPKPGLIPFDMRSAPLAAAVPDLGAGDTVFLLAGYLSPVCFANPAAARALNVDASWRLADAAATAGARLVFMSSDQVFDGETGGYIETATPRPITLFGGLKLEMERHVLALGSIVARTGWNVAWERGRHCAVAQCYEAMLRPGARMAGDNIINLTDVDDTARGLLALSGATAPPHKVYHLVSEPGVARAELAAKIKAASRWGEVMHYDVVPFASLPYNEPRPTRAYLRSERLDSLGVAFQKPDDVIRRKVALLDRWRAEAMAKEPQRA